MLVSGNETIFKGSEIEGASRRRRRYTQAAGRKDLLGVDAHDKTLAQEASGDRRCGTQAYPRQALQEGYDAPKLAAKAPAGQRDDLTLEEHSEAFEEEFGEAVSTSTVGRAITSLPDGGWPTKKVTDSSRA